MATNAGAIRSAPDWHQSLLAEVEERLAYPKKSWHNFLGEPRLAVVFGSSKDELECEVRAVDLNRRSWYPCVAGMADANGMIFLFFCTLDPLDW